MPRQAQPRHLLEVEQPVGDAPNLGPALTDVPANCRALRDRQHLRDGRLDQIDGSGATRGRARRHILHRVAGKGGLRAERNRGDQDQRCASAPIPRAVAPSTRIP
jgi:hypothetical protein